MFFTKKADTATTATIETIVSETQIAFTDIRPKWKALAQERKITKEDISALCLYRALTQLDGREEALARLFKAFKPITNNVKLTNGAARYGALKEALRMFQYSAVATWLTPDESKKLQALGQELLKEIK